MSGQTPPAFDASAFTNDAYAKQVEKPWGWELHWAPADLPYMGKIEHVNAGCRLSLQIHDKKQETMMLLEGRAKMIWENAQGELIETEMQPGQGYTIAIGQKHRLAAITDCKVVEVSTPEIGTTWRLEDDYARPDETEDQRAKERGEAQYYKGMPLVSTDDLKQLGTILTVWAHPDDETFVAGGLIAAAIRNGQEVICTTATLGERGVQDLKRWPADKLGEVRATELDAALDCLGCKHHHQLEYHDGSCADVPLDEGVAVIQKLIAQYHPDTIITFGPEGFTGHPDHQAISRWATKAGEKLAVYHAVVDEETYLKHLAQADKQFNFFFKLDQPPLRSASDCDIALRLTPELTAVKEQALQAMPSQYAAVFRKAPANFVRDALSYECFVRI